MRTVVEILIQINAPPYQCTIQKTNNDSILQVRTMQLSMIILIRDRYER